MAFQFIQGQFYRRTIVEKRDLREKPSCKVIANDHLIPESLDERACNHCGYRRNKMNPIGRELRSQHRHGDKPAVQTPDFRIESKHLTVGNDIGPADLQNPTGALRLTESFHEIVQHIADGDGLDTCINPAGTDHQGYPFGEIADHFKGEASRSDDHTGPKFRHRHTALPQDVSRVLSGAQVRGEVCGGIPQSAQIDNPRDTVPFCRRSKIAGCLLIPFRKIRASCKAMYEVIGDRYSLHRSGKRLLLEDIPLGHLHLAPPTPALEARSIPHQTPHPVAALKKPWDKPAADISGGTGYQDDWSRGVVHQHSLQP